MRDRLQKTLISVLVSVFVLGSPMLHAGEVAKANLDILGLGLEVDRTTVTTGVDVPSYVQTIFGGKQNDEAPTAPGLQAIGDLTGPGITTPISLLATPGRKFSIPALHEKGEYQLANIRLVDESGTFLQQASPSFAIINVTDVFKTQVKVRQLTAAELRERGITVDTRNYDVYEYVVIFGVDESFVEIPYPVIVDKRTHQVVPATRESPYSLPPLTVARPPRFVPPGIDEFELSSGGGGGGGENEGGRGGGPRLPAAIILPSGFGVLHQFFAVIVQVSNTAPDDAQITLDEITATIGAPGQMRVAGVKPAVTIGQPVPIYDSTTGNTYLVAGAQGSAEWTLEALKAGTHPVDVTVEATYKKPGQEPFRLRGKASTAIVVSDPRFQINFSHPDTVRADENYTAYAFVTNLSAQSQHVVLDLGDIPSCASGLVVDHICRLADTPDRVEMDMQPGEMVPVPYRLTSRITGHVFAGAGSSTDEALGVSVKLHMGVSESGIPLSPATLVMPYYARYLPSEFIAANMQLLGLGYSLATAPLNQYTAKFPRVIQNDVFQRGQEIARAGQRIFVTRASAEVDDPAEDRDAFFHLSLDLLSNVERIDHANIAPELEEWDQLRRQEKSGRRAGAAMARELERVALNAGRTPAQFVDDFAAATSHRTPFLFAYAHGADVAGKSRPYALSVYGSATEEKLDVPAEATTGWVRLLPYGELTQLNAGSEHGELALVGRWSQNMRVVVTPQSSSFTLHLIYPDTQSGSQLRTDLQITDATPGQTIAVEVVRGSRNLVVRGTNAGASVREVLQTPLRVLGAAQDLHLNERARLVSFLFNRPLRVQDANKLRDQFALTINVPKASYSITRRNTPANPDAPLQIPSAALQQDARLVNVTFDKALSTNAEYVVAIENFVDLIAGGSFAKNDVVPRIDNDAPGGILTGRVLLGDNTPVPNAEVTMGVEGAPLEIDVTDSLGRYMFEFVARDIDNGQSGRYALEALANERSTKAEGAVRLVGEVHTVNLVFLGRGSAKGQVRYNDGEVIPDVDVTIGSVLFNQFRRGRTDANGRFEIGDLPVGPLTFSVVDKDGRPTFAANALRAAGEVIEQDLVIERRGFPGTGTVRVTVRRSDTNAVVPNAQVGVYTQGYGLNQGLADDQGFIEFQDVPAGLISIIAAHFGISYESPGIEMEMKPDTIVEQTIIIPIPAPGQSGLASLEGVVTRDDPSAPGDRTKDSVVGGAIITIGQLPPVTSNADGTFLFPDLPLNASEKSFWVFDPATGRKGQFTLPTLVPGVNRFSPHLSSRDPEGHATIRVRLTSATGAPVNGYRVIEPGFPPTSFVEKGNGIYEMSGIRVPGRVNIAALPTSGTTAVYGDQMVFGSARADFNGQIAIADLRLPGQGTVITRIDLRQEDSACPVAPCYTQAFGRVALGYAVWDETEQNTTSKIIILEADQNTLLNTFTKVPAQEGLVIYTDRHPAGYAGVEARLLYEGDLRNITLRLDTLGDVTGRVFAHDRQTPIANAVVELRNGSVIYGKKLTASDGTFRFPAVAAGLSFQLVAQYVQDGIYRTGVVDGQTPLAGGPVSNLRIIMREQSTIEGQIVDRDGNPVPLANYWARELAWPYTAYGTISEPLQADINGRFILNNVFTGPFRISARDPIVQEKRGDYQGTLAFEGDTSQMNVKVSIGEAGTGTIAVTVVDSLQAFKRIENAEVTLYTGSGKYDLATTDQDGVVFFRDVPIGNYTLGAYSKAAGRAGRTGSIQVRADETTTQEIVLDFLGRVAGYLTDPESTPVNAPVRGMPVQVESGNIATRDSTDSDGRFTILGVPEGTFRLFAYDYDTGRMAFGPPNLYIDKVVQEHTNLHLELEKTAKLTVKAYLPSDNGGEGTLAPLASILVEATDYFREQQGNSLVYPKMITRYGYKITARELGGEEREIKAWGSWAPGQFEKEHHVIFPSTGSVEVLVLDGSNQPVADAKVLINGKTIYTNENGLVIVTGLPFGSVGVQASKGSVGASASGNLQSRSIPLRFTLNLGSTAGVTGRVDAEEGIGQASVGTRVVVSISSRLVSGTTRLETITDANGNYTFTGIPIGGTSVSFLFYGPDDTTIGAERTVSIPDGTTGLYPIETVKLDATPPRVLGIVPATNATDVSPSAPVVISFSEPIASSYLNTNWFQLVSTDDSANVNVTLVPTLRVDGTFDVKLVAPAPPAGQRFPLKSNVLYRVVVKNGILDTTGNALRASFGSSFTTVNYTEPAVVRVLPAETEPLQANETIKVKFNKAVDLTSIQAGNGGVVKIERLDSRGGTPIQGISIAVTQDPADSSTLLVAPTGSPFAESAFYRLTVSGMRDTQTPVNVQKDAKVVDFFSYDTKKPVATIVSPVSAGEKLVSQVAYTVGVSIVDEVSGTPSTDVQYVDFYDGAGTWLARDFTAPYAYDLHAPLTDAPTTIALRTRATDLSNNDGPQSEPFTWDVIPNAAPSNITIVNTPASAYPSQSVQSVVTFTDEGVEVTAALRITGTNVNGQPLDAILGSQLVKRASATAPWPSATFQYTLPLELQAGTAQIIATVKDLAKTGTAQQPLEILADTIGPEIVSYLPRTETRYAFKAPVTIELKVRDSETGVASAVRDIPGISPTLITETHAYDASSKIHTYRYTFSAPAKKADTRVTIRVTATDNRNNVTVASTDVIWERVDDENIPVAEWVTPLDGAALPSNLDNWQTTLRVRATDNSAITAVKFESSALAAPIVVNLPKSGTTDIFETKAVLNFPADGQPFTITATISDSDEEHDVVLPITIDPVVANAIITQSTSVSTVTLNDYQNKNVVVRHLGSATPTRFFINLPLTVTNLIVLDGAIVSAFEETKLDLTINERLFVDADSSINVSGRGYLGGRRSPEFGGSGNTEVTGRTLGGTTEGGAWFADASHGGIGGVFAGRTNATYGSIKNPSDFGAGSSGNPNSSSAGGNGGGAVLLKSGSGVGRFVLAGAIRADGDTVATAGAGGSISLQSKAFITGWSSLITANGGEESPGLAAYDLGGGGGRIAIRASDRLDLNDIARTVQARGGRNYVESGAGAGAGTIFLSRPGATNGELIVSAYDSRFKTSTQLVRGTPLAGDLTFDTITVGPRALARFDNAYTVPSAELLKVDPTARIVAPGEVPQVTITSTTPVAGGDVAQSTSINVSTTASSASGIRDVRTILSAQPADVVSLTTGWSSSITNFASTIGIPATATTGQTTLKVAVTDLAGRVTESAPLTFNIVNNAVPSITTFDVVPAEQIYANNSITVDAAASDDISVTDLALTSTVGTVVPNPATITAAPSVARQFTIAVPKTTPANTSIVLTLSAKDNFPNRAATTQQKTLIVRRDDIAPEVSVLKPAADQIFDEAAGAKFDLEVSALDREVAVQSITATFEGQPYTLTPIAGRENVFGYSGIPLPSVDGTEAVTKTITVTVTDYTPNTQTVTRTFSIRPLIDPNAPKLEWACSSPNAMYLPGMQIPLRVYAEGNTTSNGVSRVEFSINGGAPLLATETAAGSKLYNYNYTIPADATPGTIFTMRASALSTSNNEATLAGTFEIVSGTEFPTATTIEATDTSYDNRTLIIKNNGIVTVAGAHHFNTIVILSGGKLVQQPNASGNVELLSVDRMYIACGGFIDQSALGYSNRLSYPGAATPLDSSGGGHIGGGGIWTAPGGSSYGSITHPAELGASGHTFNTASYPATGGGVVRINAVSKLIVDGTIRANGLDSSTWGPGAGGSIWITSPGSITGGGTIEARGGGDTNDRGGAGGGAIALEAPAINGYLLRNLVARGSKNGVPGAAGSVYLKTASNTFGDLIIDNRGFNSAAVTTLPSIGTWPVASVNDTTVTLGKRTIFPGYHVGNSVRVVAPDGTVRGTWRITAIANDPQSVTLPNTFTFASDNATYDGYLMYAAGGLGSPLRKVVAIRYLNDQWQYDADDGKPFVTFTPQAGDRIFASFRKNTTGVYDLQQLSCGTTCGSINGIPVAELTNGWIYGNTYGGTYEGVDVRYLATETHEFTYAHDGEGRGFSLAQLPPSITLETGAIVQPGDSLRGVYRFDSVSVKGAAKVVARDAVDAPVTKETGTTFTSGDLTAPAIDATKISITQGRTGPVLAGLAGAVVDSDGAEVLVRNTAVPRAPEVMPVQGASFMTPRMNKGVLQLWKIPNNNSSWGGLNSPMVGENASARFRVGAPGILGGFGLGSHYFHFPSGGRWEVWVNGAWANSGYKQGTLLNTTRFRMEKTRDTVYWYVDDALIHSATVTVTPDTRFNFAFSNDGAYYDAVEFSSSTDGNAFGVVAANGSFSVPIYGASGESLALTARSRNASPQTTGEIVIGAIPSDMGVASVTFPGDITGGRSTTGTVTMRRAAGAEGLLVQLSSNNATVTVPATVSILPGQNSITFTAQTTAVLTPVDAVITATWGGAAATTTLRVVKDNIAPTVVVVSPVANAQFTEGSGKIGVQANVTDADSGVKRVFATFNGQTYELPKNTSKGANAYYADITAPFIDGTQNVTMDVVVSATDNSDNTVAAPAVPVVIKPVIDAALPTVEWRCTSGEAIFPVNYAARLRVYAKAPNATNTLQRVEFTITDPSGTPATYPATSLGSDLYEYIVTIPDVADGSTFNVTARAVTAAGGDATVVSSFQVVKGATELKSNTTISATDASYDNKSIVVWENVTLTIAGAHTFDRVVVLPNATVRQPDSSGATYERVNITAGAMYIACSGTISANGRGFVGSSGSTGRTWPGTFTGSVSGAGGTHGGRGGSHDGLGASDTKIYGSLVDPDTPGASGSGYFFGSCATCEPGGGIVRLTIAGSFTNDGTITANGVQNNGGGGGAGGSVRVRAKALRGIGEIHADGGRDGNSAGGGGRIALHYETSELDSTKITASGGYNGSSNVRKGGAGTVYLRQLDASGARLTDELIVDNSTINADYGTTLANLGSGTLVGINGAELTLSAAVPEWIVGSYVEFIDADGAVIADYEITGRTATSVTVRLPQSATVNVPIGTAYRGAWHFDTVTVRREGNLFAEAVAVQEKLIGGSTSEFIGINKLRFEDGTISGRVDALRVDARNLTLTSATLLQLGQTIDSTSVGTLDLRVAEDLVIDAASSIDATGRGFIGVLNSRGRTWPGVYLGSVAGAGATHGGRGGDHDTLGAADTVYYGSFMNPSTPGASGSGYHYGTCATCEPGGGVVRIRAKNISLAGKIYANGVQNNNGGGGAGGSIRIDAGTISGNGEIHADGGRDGNAAGGGGRVAVYSQSFTLDPLLVTAAGGYNGSSDRRKGGAGTVYLRTVDATGAETTDELIVDNVNLPAWYGAATTTLGSGTVLSVSGSVLTLSNPVPEWIEGSNIELLDATGDVLASYEIVARTATTVTVRLASGQSLSVLPGTAYRGTWAIDTITVRRRGILDGNGAFATKRINGGTSTEALRLPQIRVDEATFTGYFSTNEVKARRLTLNNANFMQLGNTDTSADVKRLVIDVSDLLFVDTNSRISATGGGFIGNSGSTGRTWPGTYTGSVSGAGGSHGGVGGDHESLGAASRITYGSIFDPNTPGASGSGYHYGSCSTCEPGGGVLRIKAKTLLLDGRIEANGVQNNGGGGGAGGSIRIDAESFNGAGEVHADGGRDGNAAGGGGRVAVYYEQLGMPSSRFYAAGGTNGSSDRRKGAAGTVYLKSATQQYGDLFVDNRGLNTQSPTPLPGIGTRVATSATATSLTTADANFLAPNHLNGWRVFVPGSSTAVNWPVLSNTSTTLQLDTAATPLTVGANDSYRGLLMFDTVTIRNAVVYTVDDLVRGTLDAPANSLFINDGPPVFPIAKRATVRVQSALSGDAVIGDAGAVTDTNLPIRMTVTNTRTSVVSTANANSDGSFRVPVVGREGDTFTIYATDSYASALSSAPLAVNDAIVETNTIQTFVIDPPTAASGTTLYASLRLAAPARSSDVFVHLGSSRPAASLDATVIVKSGISTIQIPITTTAVTSATDVVITATVGTSTQTATFTLLPSATSALIDLALSSPSVEGGTTVNGTVLLGAPAPSGGALVMLDSTSPSASVPESVIVPEGTTQASFAITTTQVGAPTDLQIQATWGATELADLRLTACNVMGTVTAPSSSTLTATWVDDAAPAGSTPTGDAIFDATRVAFGAASLHFLPPTSTQVRTYTFSGSTAPLATTPNDRLALWALVNPCKPPRQILVTWSDGTNSYRVSWGESRIDATATQVYAGAVPTGGQWTRLDVLTRVLGFTANKNLTGLTISVDGGEVWFDGIGAALCATPKAPKPEYLPGERVFFDDAFPAGSTSGCSAVNWDTTQVASGTYADLVIGTGSSFYQHCFTGASSPMKLAMEDVITAYVFLDPCNPPKEIMLQLNSGSWDRRVYWGENLLDWDGINTLQRRFMGPLPELGKWVRLEVPVSSMKLAGASLNGVAFTIVDGRAWFDRVGQVSRVNLAQSKPATASSSYDDDAVGAGPYRTFDGNTGTYNHTKFESGAYVEVDLGSVQPIEQIDVWRSPYCCPERSANAYVFVSDKPFESTNVNTTRTQSGVSSFYHLAPIDLPTSFEVNRTGRYVRVQLAGANYLHIAEVQAWAPITEGTPVNVGGGKNASQSSTYVLNGAAYVAALAVNGVSMGENESHTNIEAQPYWDVDLGASEAISAIDVNNVYPNCCLGRMSNAYLFVSDQAFTGTTVASSLAQEGVSAYYRGPALSIRQFQVNRTGQFIRLQLTSTDYLHPYEVKVWSPSRTIGALAKPLFDFSKAKEQQAPPADH